MSGVVMVDGSCEDCDVDERPTICAWCVRDGRATDVAGASHSICPTCKLVYFELPHVVIPRLQGVVARLDGGNYLGDSMRRELVADLRAVIARLVRGTTHPADEENPLG